MGVTRLPYALDASKIDVDTSKIDAHGLGVGANAADQDPVPDGFGRDTAAWQPSPSHDPVQVATLHLQHLLIAAVRRAWPRVRPDSGLTGRTLADALGTPHSIRPFEKRLAGAQPLQLEDVVRLTLYLGDEILGALPPHAAELFPEPYRPLLGRWKPGQATLPTFQRYGLHEWDATVTWLAAFLDREVEAGRDHLLTPGGVTHALTVAITEFGTDPSTIEVDDHPPSDQAVQSLTIGPATNITVASLAYLPDQPGRPRVTAERIANILYATADREANHRIVILVAGPATTRQLRTGLPDMLEVQANTPFTLRFQTVTRNLPPGTVPDDLDVTVIGRAQRQLHSAVVAALISKRR